MGGGGAGGPKWVFVGKGGGVWGSDPKCLENLFSFFLKRADISSLCMALERFSLYLGEVSYLSSGFALSLVES